MHEYSRAHLSSGAVECTLERLLRDERPRTAELLSYIAEFDARQLYRAAGFPSMYAYLVGRWNFSEGSAYKRLYAARAAREFPVLFEAVADGRLHLSAVVLLSKHLLPGNVDELVAVAARKSKAAVEELIAHLFPKRDVPLVIRAVPTTVFQTELSPGKVQNGTDVQFAPLSLTSDEAPMPTRQPSPAIAPMILSTSPPVDRPRVTPLAPQKFALQVTISGETREKLRRAQELLGFQVASSGVAEVLDRALDALITKLEKRKYAATSNPRTVHEKPRNPTTIPAEVRRKVYERDGGQCTFVSATGQRCPERKGLEFDHVLEVARGGIATVDSVRLRCRPHNQYTAEQTFGVEFMEGRRRAARESRRDAQSKATALRARDSS